MTDALAAFERLLIATQTLAHVADRDIVRRALEQLAPQPSEAERVAEEAWEVAHGIKHESVAKMAPIIQAYGDRQRAEERERAAIIAEEAKYPPCFQEHIHIAEMHGFDRASDMIAASIRDVCKP